MRGEKTKKSKEGKGEERVQEHKEILLGKSDKQNAWERRRGKSLIIADGQIVIVLQEGLRRAQVDRGGRES